MFIAGTRAAVKTNQSKPISVARLFCICDIKKKIKKLFKDQFISTLNVGCITCEILGQIF